MGPAKKRGADKKRSSKKRDGTLVGEVTHYFNHLNVAVIKMQSGELRLMDPIRFKGHTTDFKQSIASMQINHKAVDRVSPGDDFGLQVKKRVRAGDQVFSLTA